jgi:solute carrier family 25 (mitochondrial phosphate transporter), member 23/24/25/41
VTCPNSRCCYRSKQAWLASALPGGGPVKQGKQPMNFCDFRRYFLLLPQDKMIVEYWLCAGHPSCCDIDCPVQYYEDLARKKGSSPWGHLFAGAVAGGMSRTATAPLEVCAGHDLTNARFMQIALNRISLQA